jgi:hypothetical protein
MPQDPQIPTLADDCFLTNRPSMTHAQALEVFRQRIVGITKPETVALTGLSAHEFGG